MIKFKHRGNFNNLQRFFIRMSGAKYLRILEKYGQEGVSALAAATPSDSGETANSWNFEIERGRDTTVLRWINTSSNDGAVIVILLQYGHGTGTGGYVQGRDFINPALRPIFDEIANEAWKEVTQ